MPLLGVMTLIYCIMKLIDVVFGASVGTSDNINAAILYLLVKEWLCTVSIGCHFLMPTFV